MVRGTLGMIVCPVLEDELVYSLMNDKDEKNIYIVDTGPAHSLKERFELNNIPYALIDEWDFDNGYDNVDRENGFNIVILANKLGLHADPKVLKSTLEDQIRLYQDRFDAIALYYGMCGNGGWDPSVWAKNESIETPVLVFRDECGKVCDDCIAVAVGGPDQYLKLLKKYTGMLFITPALATDWDEYADELDFLKGFEVMGITTLPEVFDVYGYKNSVKLDTGLGKRNSIDDHFKSVETKTGLKMVVAEGDLTDLVPAEQLYAEAKTSLMKN